MTTALKPVSTPTIEPEHLPQNVEAEAALLGALMIDNRLVSDIMWLPKEAFWEQVHGRIYAAICDEVAKGGVANPITIKPRFASDAALEELGGAKYLATLTGSGAAMIGAKQFAQQILDLYQRRELVLSLQEGIERALDTSKGEPFSALIETVDEAVNKVAVASPSHGKHVASLDKAWDAMIARYDAILAGGVRPGLRVDGLDDFNDLTGGGMNDGDLIVIAGRPGMGKSAVAVTIASSCARANIGTQFFSLEMSKEQLIERQVTDICYDYHGSSFTYAALKKGKLATPHLDMVRRARVECASWPLIYDDTADMRVGHLIGKMRRMKRVMEAKGTPLKVCIVDYLGLLKADNDYRGNKVLEVSEITRALKIAAKDLGLTIILLCQLSRGVEQRENKRPMLSDLRDSGSIEQDADMVFFLYREEYYLKNEEPKKGDDIKSINAWEKWRTDMEAARDRMDLIAAKVRGSETGHRKIYFMGAYQAVRGSNFHSGAN